MRLEDFIKNNYDEFNNEEPSKGHFERFEQRLNASKQHNNPKTIRWLVSLAALLMGLVIGLTVFMNNDNNGEYINSQTCTLSAEALETQNHYTSALQAEAKQISKLLTNVDSETRNEVMSEVRTILEDSETFNSEFCNSSDSGIAIMVEYYQANIQALQNIKSVFATN